ncbi:hypothetical protein TNIN_110851 [Trichonephila inaurata madagascariensis]|uniref:Uncharacterized protein n=1 Tax=Trichonephila inaurata madagascariensis TaxID=2747483 RepID=A0A8X6XC43_9ARAC|nr:hypothetical protein TNIN_110851 [Trichonephila inaurata madagascariensis]
MVRLNHPQNRVSSGRKKSHRKELTGMKDPSDIRRSPHKEETTCEPQGKQEESTLLYIPFGPSTRKMT